MSTPSHDLAKKILERLIAEKLVTDDDAKKLVTKLSDGKVRPEDWRLAIEKATEKQAKA